MIVRSYGVPNGCGTRKRFKHAIENISKNTELRLTQKTASGIAPIERPTRRKSEQKTGPTMRPIGKKSVQGTAPDVPLNALKSWLRSKSKKSAVLGAANTKDGRQ